MPLIHIFAWKKRGGEGVVEEIPISNLISR